MANTDWEGRDIVSEEPDDHEILIWEVDPHPQSRSYDVLWCRSLQQMLECVTNNLESRLEDFTQEELLEEPFVMKFRLRKTTVAEWREMERGRSD